ncbi:unnamed protein product [Rotaria socialis]|uniref:Uncharacterized protein n=1 Tax=Rotaria socialis TaxID=392032 RepID=A0A820MQE3_9BILA|nr:unnamed protein product [Rotaria socialis]CAF4481130.1 unnamed protein product [Rotaria socialis]CAF4538685.1 unnamed protein product [Rotaria socialis]CAF4729219.1 unnamed protein product [Rotaria socialis]
MDKLRGGGGGYSGRFTIISAIVGFLCLIPAIVLTLSGAAGLGNGGDNGRLVSGIILFGVSITLIILAVLTCCLNILKDIYWHSDYTLLYNSEFDLISLINQIDAADFDYLRILARVTALKFKFNGDNYLPEYYENIFVYYKHSHVTFTTNF